MATCASLLAGLLAAQSLALQRRVLLALLRPPAVLLTAQLLMGVLFSAFGLLLATPLAVTLIVLIQMLYVQDLPDSPVRVLGEHEQ